MKSADRPVAGFRLYVVVWPGGSVAAEAALDRPRKLASNVGHGEHTERGVARTPTPVVLLPFAPVREHRYEHVFRVGAGFRDRDAERSGEMGARVDETGGRDHVEVATVGGRAAAQRQLDVRAHRPVVLTDPRDARDVVVGVGDGRGALDGDEVAEAERREAGDELDAEDVALLDLDVETRRRQNVVGRQSEVV